MSGRKTHPLNNYSPLAMYTIIEYNELSRVMEFIDKQRGKAMKLKELEILKAEVIEAMKNTGMRRTSSVADVIEGKDLNVAQLTDLLVDVFFAGRQTGKDELKKEIARL